MKVKVNYVISAAILLAITAFASCQAEDEECEKISPPNIHVSGTTGTPGYTISYKLVNPDNEKCYIETDTIWDATDTIAFNVLSISDLQSTNSSAENAILNGKAVKIFISANIFISTNDYNVMVRFAQLKQMYNDRLVVSNESNYTWGPAVSGQVLDYETWVNWGKPMPLGTTPHKWHVFQFDLAKFESDGVPASTFDVIVQMNEISLVVANAEDLNALPALIEQHQYQNTIVSVKFILPFEVNNGQNMAALEQFKIQIESGKAVIVPDLGCVGPATDSIAASIILLRWLYENNFLNSTTMIGGKYFYVPPFSGYVTDNTVVRTWEVNASDFPALYKILPRNIFVDHDLSAYDLSNAYYDLIQKQMQIFLEFNGNRPIVGFNDIFSLIFSEPASQGADQNQPPLFVSDQKFKIGNYGLNPGDVGHNRGLDIGQDICFNTGNNIGFVLLESYNIATNHGQNLCYITLKEPSNRNLIINTNNQAFINTNGNIILHIDFVKTLVRSLSLSGNNRLNLSDMTVYIAENSNDYLNFFGLGTLYFEDNRITLGPVSNVTFNLPTGKQCYTPNDNGLYTRIEREKIAWQKQVNPYQQKQKQAEAQRLQKHSAQYKQNASRLAQKYNQALNKGRRKQIMQNNRQFAK